MPQIKPKEGELILSIRVIRVHLWLILPKKKSLAKTRLFQSADGLPLHERARARLAA